eukprot:NODE_5383_length_682_cov_71.289100_g5009_i0.p1 GENE.NODE_5383_length_682_cov_71.289100_g5009_i0~~NODE_5383_length_682_cov_71.289100_g5009_i0.p1  ORF type:complete len:202 (+),score=24.97 NODE_5383_length_682_cov_71.289100_g5009_i0:92-607(+)
MDLPLENAWRFWIASWKVERMDPYPTFSSIQSFWENFNLLFEHDPPSDSHIHLFKEGVQPLWEDSQNQGGGTLKIIPTSSAVAVQLWTRLILLTVGEQLAGADILNGISVLSGKYSVLKVWCSTTDAEKIADLRTSLSELLGKEFFRTVTFFPHKLVLRGARKQLAEGRSR